MHLQAIYGRPFIPSLLKTPAAGHRRIGVCVSLPGFGYPNPGFGHPNRGFGYPNHGFKYRNLGFGYPNQRLG